MRIDGFQHVFWYQQRWRGFFRIDGLVTRFIDRRRRISEILRSIKSATFHLNPSQKHYVNQLSKNNTNRRLIYSNWSRTRPRHHQSRLSRHQPAISSLNHHYIIRSTLIPTRFHQTYRAMYSNGNSMYTSSATTKALQNGKIGDSNDRLIKRNDDNSTKRSVSVAFSVK